MQTKRRKQQNETTEPRIIVKPVGRYGGLDGIHIALIIVVALLFALLLVVAYSKPVVVKQINNTTAAKPVHTSSEVLARVQRVLASYANVNSSLSLLAYFSKIQNATAAYVPSAKEWLVDVPAVNPASGITFYTDFIVNDSNISKVLPLLQAAIPQSISNNSVVYEGTVKLYNKYACSTQNPLQVYWFIDPYAPGSVRSLLNATALESKFGRNISIGIKIFTSQATESVAREYGLANAELLGKYIFCASNQSGFGTFVANLNSEYAGSYMGNTALRALANESGLNVAELSRCVNSSQTIINNQELLAQYYNITQSPVAIVNCEYMTLPQTAQNAICFANSTLCR
ncbi:MAG: DsbA family protein [Candidatus Micrarchaeia archaeon]